MPLALPIDHAVPTVPELQRQLRPVGAAAVALLLDARRDGVNGRLHGVLLSADDLGGTDTVHASVIPAVSLDGCLSVQVVKALVCALGQAVLHLRPRGVVGFG